MDGLQQHVHDVAVDEGERVNDDQQADGIAPRAGENSGVRGAGRARARTCGGEVRSARVRGSIGAGKKLACLANESGTHAAGMRAPPEPNKSALASLRRRIATPTTPAPSTNSASAAGSGIAGTGWESGFFAEGRNSGGPASAGSARKAEARNQAGDETHGVTPS